MRSRSPTATSSMTPQSSKPSSSVSGACSMPGQAAPGS
jgi:hypothetical protein